ncbi:hypothetical protein ACW7EJ_01620 [Acinetobacter soli]
MLAVLLSRKLPLSTSDLILFLNAFVFIVVSTVFGLQGAESEAIPVTDKIAKLLPICL